MSALKYFWKELENQGVENVGAHFVAVTDPDTSLQALAVEKDLEDTSMLLPM